MNGFSLLECIITLIFIALLALIAFGSNNAWLQKQLSYTFTDQLVHDLQFSRQQAILRGALITLCPTLDFALCADTTDWSHGYLIHTHNDEVLITRENTRGTLTNSRKQIQFAPTGFSHSTNSTFIYTLGEIERRIIINLQGRIRVE
jgi:type IV fimbrial biogenesis protein FimT